MGICTSLKTQRSAAFRIDYYLGISKKPDAEIYLQISCVGILEKQTRALSEEGWIYVLNTSVFIVVDYSPEAMLGMLGNDYKSLYGPVGQ